LVFAAVRKLRVEAVDNGLLALKLASGIARVKGVGSAGPGTLLNAPDTSTKKGQRDN
jgi:hypothetical protein